MNLGSIYQDLGETDKALRATVKAIEIDNSNIKTLQNLKSLSGDITIITVNLESANKAYEILLNCNDFSHRKIGHLFVQVHLDDIQAAAGSNPIISDQNQAFHRLASDWRFRTALTLLIPTHKETEEFLTRLRKEFLADIKNRSSTPPELKPLLEALATQCFLNEYVYWQSDEVRQWIDDLIKDTRKSKKPSINPCP